MSDLSNLFEDQQKAIQSLDKFLDVWDQHEAVRSFTPETYGIIHTLLESILNTSFVVHDRYAPDLPTQESVSAEGSE